MTRSIRETYIGSSDSPPILGVPSYGTTEVDVWLEKTGQAAPREETALMKWGRLHEVQTIREYRRQTGRAVDRRHRRRFHPKFGFIGATIDGDAGDRLVEAKWSPFADDYGEPGDGPSGLPMYVRVQVQHQLMVTGYRLADVPVLVRGYDLRTWTLEADRSFGRDLLAELRAWWDLRIVRGVPPEPDDGEAYADWIRRLFPVDDGSTLQATPDQVALLDRLRSARAAVAMAESERDLYLNQIRLAMGAATTLLAPGVRVTHKAHERRDVDWAAIAGDYRLALEGMRTILEPGTTAGLIATLLEDPATVELAAAVRDAVLGDLDVIARAHTTTKLVKRLLPKFADEISEEVPSA